MSNELIADDDHSREMQQRDDRVRFHLSMDVGNLAESVAFFEKLFGSLPAKLRADYAKFEIQEPPVVLSLQPGQPSSGGPLNHVGLRMPNAEALVEMQRRLESCGLSTERMEGVECCYSRQTKFWLHDPDGVLWEVYTLDDNIDHHGFSHEPAAIVRTVAANDSTHAVLDKSAPSVWSHRLGQPIPTQLFIRDASVDSIHLQGTMNVMCTGERRGELLSECFRALNSSGIIRLHQLTSDRPISSDCLNLTGAASVVEHVLPIEDLLAELRSAGFSNVHFDKFGKSPCFVRDGTELRETILTARKSSKELDEESRDCLSSSSRILYKGPADQIVMCGITLERGRIVELPQRDAEHLGMVFGDQVVVFG